MKEIVDRYLDHRLSRRGFVSAVTRAGFSLAAASAIVDSLAPLAAAEAPPAAEGGAGEIVEGTGGELLVAQLRAAGVELLFHCNASGTYPVFDALLDRPGLPLILVPQEGQMIAVAQGYALASGRTAFTLNGSVGFPNTLNNLYNAWKDRTPLVTASQREATLVQGGRDAFEEWDDYLAPAAPFTRWRWTVGQTGRIPELTRRAFRVAATPPEGPVALAFPLDVLAKKGTRARVLPKEEFLRPVALAPEPRAIEEAARRLVEAAAPLLILGPEVTRSGANAEVLALADLLALPVTQGELLFDDFPTEHPLFLGRYAPDAAGRRPDLVLNLGCKMPDGHGMIPPGAAVVHASADAELVGRVVETDLGIVAGVRETAAALVAAVRDAAGPSRLRAIRERRFEAIRARTATIRARRARQAAARWDLEPLTPERVGGELERILDRDAIVVPELAMHSWLGLGENAALAEIRFAPGGKSKIGRTTGSALGWGVGAAIGVQLARPDRQVVALQGDGGFLFSQAETLWTMARYEVPVIVVILNNRSYNGPRNKVLRAGGRQARAGREMTSYLGSPDVDFARVAAGFGVAGETVTKPGEVRPALERAVRSSREGRPYLIDAVVGRTGLGADSTWFPEYSLAKSRRPRG